MMINTVVKVKFLVFIVLVVVYADDPDRLPTKCESKLFYFID